MTRNLALLLGVVALLGAGGTARADIARYVNFQGRLADDGGNPLTGSYSISFRIYDALTGGTACHDAAQTVAVNSGLFNVNIGEPSGVNAACTFGQPYYLEIQVGTDAAMTPRLPLLAAPYAFTAQRLVAPGTNTAYVAGNAAGMVPLSNGTVNTNLNADQLDGTHASGFATAGHGHAGPYAICVECFEGTETTEMYLKWGTACRTDPSCPMSGQILGYVY